MNITTNGDITTVRICCGAMWEHLADDRNYEEVKLWNRCPWCDEKITGRELV